MTKKLTTQEKILRKAGVLIWEGNYIPKFSELTSNGYLPLYLTAVGDSFGGMCVIALVWPLENGSVPIRIERIAKEVRQNLGNSLQLEMFVQ